MQLKKNIMRKKICISFEQIVQWGATASYSENVVRKIWGSKDVLVIDEILNLSVHPHFICWALLREEILPSRLLHLIAQDWVADLWLQYKEKGIYMDFRLESLINMKRAWLDGQLSDSLMLKAAVVADDIHDLMSSSQDTDAIVFADIVSGLMSLSASECINRIYHATFPKCDIKREMVTGKWGEDWNARLQRVKSVFEVSSTYAPLWMEYHALPDVLNAKDTLMQSDGELLPIGTILPFVGDLVGDANLQAQLEGKGWLYCDGRSLAIEEYEELYAVISGGWGCRGNKEFTLPDLRGYFLRAVSGTSTVDPDREKRVQINAGGNIGNKVGTSQGYATCFSDGSYSTVITNGDTCECRYDSGCQEDDHVGKNAKERVVSLEGGDAETRPRNKAVYYFIKCVHIKDDPIPAGLVVGYTGQAAIKKDKWFFCDGHMIPLDSTLFKVMKYAHGGDTDNVCLPDFRGYFLRGVSEADYRDPSAASREVPQPELIKQGNKLGVGSVQNQATAVPYAGYSFKVSTPDNSIDGVIIGTTKHLYNWNDKAVKQTLVLSAGEEGEKESVPVNHSVNWLVASEELTSSHVPCGAIIACGSLLKQSADWKLCDGTPLRKNEYAELFNVVGNIYQKPDCPTDSFNLPDFQGYFLCGSNKQEVGLYVVGDHLDVSTTGKPNTDFNCSILRLPTSSYNLSGETCTTGCKSLGNKTINLSGGDSETRPLNASVYFYIKCN